MNPQYKEVGESFVNHFYSQIDNESTKANSVALYHENALLTFEGDQKSGKQAIMEKMMSLPPTKRKITRCDCQPTMSDGGIMVVVLGQVITPGQDKSLGFTNVFFLKPDGAGYYIFNEVFLLNLHDQ